MLTQIHWCGIVHLVNLIHTLTKGGFWVDKQRIFEEQNSGIRYQHGFPLKSNRDNQKSPVQ